MRRRFLHDLQFGVVMHNRGARRQAFKEGVAILGQDDHSFSDPPHFQVARRYRSPGEIDSYVVVLGPPPPVLRI
jgi:hypothetical protein